jgi:hypothetical protein
VSVLICRIEALVEYDQRPRQSRYRPGGDTVTLPEEWQPTAEGTAANLTAELARERPVGHPLSGVSVAAVALGPEPDDVLFRILDGSGRLAVVHLTWRRGIESLPWPFTTLYDDEAAWLSHIHAEGCKTTDA